jgi:hypothetical protein
MHYTLECQDLSETLFPLAKGIGLKDHGQMRILNGLTERQPVPSHKSVERLLTVIGLCIERNN